MAMQIIPAVDVLDGRVVRLLRGDYDAVTDYGGDPVDRVRRWVEAGAPLVHVVDLAGAREGRPDRFLWRRLGEAGVPFQVGGGIRDAESAQEALTVGAARVVLGTAAVWDPSVLARIHPIDRVVAAVDVRGERATGAGWLDEGRALEEVLDDLAGTGVRRLLVTGILRDGTMEGPQTELLRRVIGRGGFSVIASGGVGSLDDLQAVASLGCEGVVVGRALYEGRFTLDEALAAVGSAEAAR